MPNTTSPLIIGRDLLQGYHFNGYLDELRLWNVARSQSQIAGNMNRALTGTEPGLTAYWGFNGTPTNSAVLTGSACDGTLSNAPIYVISGVPFVPAAITEAASGIRPTSARLNGTVNPGNLATTAWFEWGLTTNYGSGTAPTSFTATNAALGASNILTGLSLGQTYHYRVVATNNLGTVLGEDVSFTPQNSTNTVTTLNDSGSGSLRQTLAASTDGETIMFATTGTIILTTGELEITNSLTISGPGATNLSISGNAISRVLNISNPNAVVTIADVTICNGKAANGTNGSNGINGNYDITVGGTGSNGANGGGILNQGHLTLNRCILSNNSAGNGGIGGNGGSFEGIGDQGGCGGNGGNGGGIHNTGALLVLASTLANNSAGAGGNSGGGGVGGIGANGGNGSSAGNGGNGGGIYNSGTASISSSTLAYNPAGTGGNGGNGGSTDGSLYHGGCGGNGGNGGNGGGIFNEGILSLHFSTLASNATGANGAGGYGGLGIWGDGNNGTHGTSGNGGGVFNNATATAASLHNCLVVLNSAVSGGLDPDLSGDFTSQGYNLVRLTGNSSGLVNGLNHDLTGTPAAPINPLLSPLTNHGGPTPTLALLPGSPAIDAGDDTLTGTDQRGFARYSGQHVDIGAYELNAASLGYSAPIMTTPACTTSNVAPGLFSASFSFSVNPNGLNTTVWIDYGITASYGCSSVILSMGYTNVSVATNLTMTGFSPGTLYHYRVNASSPAGTTSSADQTFATTASGDLDGDGVVSEAEMNLIGQNYWSTTANYLTGLTSAGPGRFAFGLSNTAGLNFSVLMSSNLTDWTPLPNATGFYFDDPGASNAPVRFYRLRWP